MNKFYGTVGFEVTEETSPGIWEAHTVEHGYSGDLIRHIDRYDSGNKVNANYSINNQISIVCDPYALENFQFIKFVRFLGTAWRVSSVEVNYPRLLLNLGEVYPEEATEAGE